MYSYRKRNDVKPAKILFLQGCFIEATSSHKPNQSNKLKYGIEIIISEQPKVIRKVYASCAETRSAWIEALRRHARVYDILEYYTIGKELGLGRFSTVHVATRKSTEKRYAVKVIDTSELDGKQAEALRTEIAVLKLLHHPNIIRLRNVFINRRETSMVQRDKER